MIRLGFAAIFGLILACHSALTMPAKVGGTLAPDGKTEIHVDLPAELHLRNKGGSDGAGLCVFTSIDHAAKWQNIPALDGFRDWMTRYPGGGWPEKVDKMIAKLCAERGVPVPAYIQIQENDWEILKAACKSGRMPCVTYSVSPTGRYGGKRIAHMVNISHGDDQYFAVLDNNYPGVNAYEWMTPEEFKRAAGPLWAVILLGPGPPPPPFNGKG